jgi:DNA-binding FadR family transcriptional regulator
MAFVPVRREPVSAAVFAQLRAGILSGELAAGEALPAERALAETFEVNRHAVREALKRLQQAGLVEVAHGGATRVLDFRRTAGLDLLPHLLDGPQVLAGEVLRSGLEMRRVIGSEVARLAAVRADDAARTRILDRARDCQGQGRTCLDADRAFWTELVEAADNIAFRLAFNSLVQVIDAHAEQMDEILDEGRTDAAGHLELADAVVRGDAETAAAVAHRVLTAALVAAGRFMPGSPRTRAAEPEPEPEPAGAAAESSRQGPR